jgi:TRAP-type C4-dicarboxylate transport system permease small subunit
MSLATFLQRFCTTTEAIAGLILALVTILVVASAVGRYLFAAPIPDAFDLSRLLIGAAVTWGFAALGYRGSHITVDIVAEALPPRGRRIMEALAWTLVLVFVILLAWKMLSRVTSAYASNEQTFDLRIVVWPLMALIWAGAAASVVTVGARLVLLVTGRGGLDEFGTARVADEARD